MIQVQELYSDDTFFRLENHEVMTENGKVIQNWMWTEVPDMVSHQSQSFGLKDLSLIDHFIQSQINVLIRDVKGDYILLHQSKYGIDGESYAGTVQDVTAMR
jgi:hypothetical protein